MRRYHTLIIGSGCAGYSAAERLYKLGIEDIAIVTEGRLMGTSRNTGSDKQTYYKLSLSDSDGDSVREMAKDLYSGGGVMGEHALIEAAYSVRCFMHLVELGVPFPTNEYGEYAGYKTDHDPRRRATSTGPLTSKHMTEALEGSVAECGIEIIDNSRVIKIITEDDSVRGVAILNTEKSTVETVAAENVILCVGGPAGIYKNTVYPESQRGATGLAIDAGATLSNMDQWQYGIASTKFRWNLSGSYQQVIPRYVSVDGTGKEREFLYDALGEEAVLRIFEKGYQWPFDTRKICGSSRVDLLVFDEIKKGRRVYLDFMKDPRGFDLQRLQGPAYDYLASSGALVDTPIRRLEKMNIRAIELYKSAGIDLYSEYLEIGVCAQHANGGIMVDENWQSDVSGLYAAGEAAGTFGVYRPGGAALNSTQVGALRAAEHISKKEYIPRVCPEYILPKVRYGRSNVTELRELLQSEMTLYAAHDRSVNGMKGLYEKVCELTESFFDAVSIEREGELYELFTLYDTVLTQRATLSAMLLCAREIGTHGSAIVDKKSPEKEGVRSSRTLTKGFTSRLEPVSEMPDPELWFEKLLARNK